MADPEKAVATSATEEEMSEEEMEEEEGGERKELVDKLMKDPQVLAALQTKLRRFLGTHSGYISVSWHALLIDSYGTQELDLKRLARERILAFAFISCMYCCY